MEAVKSKGGRVAVIFDEVLSSLSVVRESLTTAFHQASILSNEHSKTYNSMVKIIIMTMIVLIQVIIIIGNITTALHQASILTNIAKRTIQW